jgi:hypothetical protein
MFHRFILTATLICVVSVEEACAQALPPCPVSRKIAWTACRGSYTYDDWSKYSGDFKDDKRHGQGTVVYPDGQK